MLDSACLNYHVFWNRTSSVAHHSPHTNAIFVYRFMQELFVDKIHFFKFLCLSDKLWLHQLNIIARGNTYGEIPSWKGKYPMLRTNTKPHQLIRQAKISYSIVSIVFRKFLYQTYWNGLNQVPRSSGTPSISKSTNRVSSIHFVGNPHFSILLHKVQYLKNLFMSPR